MVGDMNDSFNITGNVIVCHSTSGSTYEITSTACTCPGFGFRRQCRHMTEAKAQGLFTELKRQSQKVTSFNSPIIHKARLRAILIWLEKQGFTPSGNMVLTIEQHVRADTKPHAVMALAKKIQISEQKG